MRVNSSVVLALTFLAILIASAEACFCPGGKGGIGGRGGRGNCICYKISAPIPQPPMPVPPYPPMPVPPYPPQPYPYPPQPYPYPPQPYPQPPINCCPQPPPQPSPWPCVPCPQPLYGNEFIPNFPPGTFRRLGGAAGRRYRK